MRAELFVCPRRAPPPNKFLDLPAAAGGGPAAQIQKVWFACRGCTQPQPTHVGRQPCRKLKPRPVRTLAGDCDKLGWVLTQHSTRPQLLHPSRGLAWIRRANLSNGTSIKMRWKIWDEQNLLALTENRRKKNDSQKDAAWQRGPELPLSLGHGTDYWAESLVLAGGLRNELQCS